MTTEHNATAQLADYAARVSVAALPQSVVDQTVRVLTDTVGVLLGSSRTDVIRKVADDLITRGGAAEATVVGQPKLVPAEQAAFINGAGGHQIELDDSHGSSLTHPAAVIVPAALAAVELAKDASGADMLAGLVAGYDVSARFSKACGVQSIVDRHFHATSVCGTIGAAAAVGRILGLDTTQMTAALGLAACQSAGLLVWEDDPTHVAKSFQTGMASRNGVFAAQLAASGYRGAMNALAGRYNAITAFGGAAADSRRLTEELGSRWEITLTDFKRYGSCRHTHAPVDAVLAIMAAEHFAVDDIESIDVWLPHSSVPVVDRNPLWTHNLQYVVALAVHERAVLPEHFCAPWTDEPRIAALSAKVMLRGSDVLEAAYPGAKGAIVTVRTADRDVTSNNPLPVGHRDNPITASALEEKFLSLATPSLGESGAHQLRRQLGAVAEAPSLEPVLAALRTPAPS